MKWHGMKWHGLMMTMTSMVRTTRGLVREMEMEIEKLKAKKERGESPM